MCFSVKRARSLSHTHARLTVGGSSRTRCDEIKGQKVWPIDGGLQTLKKFYFIFESLGKH